MSSSWKRVGPIAAGGTVFYLEESVAHIWLGTGAGLFRSSPRPWHPQPICQPLPAPTALHVAQGILLAGGMRGELLYSTDGGASWYQGRAPQIHDTLISCLVVSPAFAHDRVVLAGTHGAGVLRSTNRGKDWQLTNFGLQDLHIVALATAPGEEQLGVPYQRVGRWIALAATTEGLYRSPNGGRAWQRVDLGPVCPTIQTLAVSPTFAEDEVVFAGSEAHGLFRSSDRGRTWSVVNLELERPPAINALWLHPQFAQKPVCLIGAADGRLLRSGDGGAHWEVAHASEDSVLALGGASTVYAGLYQEGVLRSHDQGRTWASIPVHAHPFLRLRADNDSLLAWGARINAHQTEDGGQTWTSLALPQGQIPLTAVADRGWVIGTDTGIFRWTAEEQWAHDLVGESITALASTPGGLVAGSHRGEVFQAQNEGKHWRTLGGPRPPRPILALAANGRMTVAATPGSNQELWIWLWDAASESWERWHRARSASTSAHLLMDEQTVWAALGRTLWRANAQGWNKILETDHPILRLEEDIEKDRRYVLTSRTVLSITDDATFNTLTLPTETNVLVDLAIAVRSRRLYLLTVGGGLWTRQL